MFPLAAYFSDVYMAGSLERGGAGQVGALRRAASEQSQEESQLGLSEVK